jgi:hypothetical protein
MFLVRVWIQESPFFHLFLFSFGIQEPALSLLSLHLHLGFNKLRTVTALYLYSPSSIFRCPLALILSLLLTTTPSLPQLRFHTLTAKDRVERFIVVLLEITCAFEVKLDKYGETYLLLLLLLRFRRETVCAFFYLLCVLFWVWVWVWVCVRGQPRQIW